jgi:UrcA family protein
MKITAMNSVQSRIASPSRHMMWTAIGVATVSLLSVNAHAAGAYATDAPAQRTVDYTDLDLSAPTDANVLYARLQKAAKMVCEPFESRDLRMLGQHKVCYQQALSSAVATVNHTAITALYQSDKNLRFASRRSDVPSRS